MADVQVFAANGMICSHTLTHSGLLKDHINMNESEPTDKPVDQFGELKAKRAIFLLGMFFLLTFMLTLFLYAPLWVSAAAGVELGMIDPSGQDEFVAGFELPIEILVVSVAALIILWMTRNTLPGQLNQGALISVGWKPVSRLVVFLAFALGILISAGFLFVVDPLLTAIEPVEFGPNATRAATIITAWQHFYWAMLLIVVAPAIEEFLFRGVLFTGLRNSFGIYVSGVMVSLLFVLAHTADAIHYWPAWINLTALAIATMLFRIKTGSLVPSMAVHAGYNSVIVASHLLSHGHSF